MATVRYERGQFLLECAPRERDRAKQVPTWHWDPDARCWKYAAHPLVLDWLCETFGDELVVQRSAGEEAQNARARLPFGQRPSHAIEWSERDETAPEVFVHIHYDDRLFGRLVPTYRWDPSRSAWAFRNEPRIVGAVEELLIRSAAAPRPSAIDGPQAGRIVSPTPYDLHQDRRIEQATGELQRLEQEEDRLKRLVDQQRELLARLAGLERQVAASEPTPHDLEQERRIEELAQRVAELSGRLAVIESARVATAARASGAGDVEPQDGGVKPLVADTTPPLAPRRAVLEAVQVAHGGSCPDEVRAQLDEALRLAGSGSPALSPYLALRGALRLDGDPVGGLGDLARAAEGWAEAVRVLDREQLDRQFPHDLAELVKARLNRLMVERTGVAAGAAAQAWGDGWCRALVTPDAEPPGAVEAAAALAAELGTVPAEVGGEAWDAARVARAIALLRAGDYSSALAAARETSRLVNVRLRTAACGVTVLAALGLASALDLLAEPPGPATGEDLTTPTDDARSAAVSALHSLRAPGLRELDLSPAGRVLRAALLIEARRFDPSEQPSPGPRASVELPPPVNRGEQIRRLAEHLRDAARKPDQEWWRELAQRAVFRYARDYSGSIQSLLSCLPPLFGSLPLAEAVRLAVAASSEVNARPLLSMLAPRVACDGLPRDEDLCFDVLDAVRQLAGRRAEQAGRSDQNDLVTAFVAWLLQRGADRPFIDSETDLLLFEELWKIEGRRSPGLFHLIVDRRTATQGVADALEFCDSHVAQPGVWLEAVRLGAELLAGESDDPTPAVERLLATLGRAEDDGQRGVLCADARLLAGKRRALQSRVEEAERREGLAPHGTVAKTAALPQVALRVVGGWGSMRSRFERQYAAALRPATVRWTVSEETQNGARAADLVGGVGGVLLLTFYGSHAMTEAVRKEAARAHCLVALCHQPSLGTITGDLERLARQLDRSGTSAAGATPALRAATLPQRPDDPPAASKSRGPARFGEFDEVKPATGG